MTQSRSIVKRKIDSEKSTAKNRQRKIASPIEVRRVQAEEPAGTGIESPHIYGETTSFKIRGMYTWWATVVGLLVRVGVGVRV